MRLTRTIIVALTLSAMLAGCCDCKKTSAQASGVDSTAQADSAEVVTESVTEDHDSADEDMVYICTGATSKRYHSTYDCMGLSNCSGEIEEVSVSEAEDMGRTPCRRCCE